MQAVIKFEDALYLWTSIMEYSTAVRTVEREVNNGKVYAVFEEEVNKANRELTQASNKLIEAFALSTGGWTPRLIVGSRLNDWKESWVIEFKK